MINPMVFYCITPATLNRYIGNNKTGQRVYDNKEEVIKVKKEEGINERISFEDREILSKGVYYSIDKVKIGDKIDGNVIKSVIVERGAYGDILGYKLLY